MSIQHANASRVIHDSNSGHRSRLNAHVHDLSGSAGASESAEALIHRLKSTKSELISDYLA